MSDRDAGGTGTLSAEAAQTSTKLIYTANLTIESKDFDAARTALTDAVSAAGGYLESSNESSYTGSSRTLSLTIRVPQDNYASFLEAAAQAGNLVDKSEQVQDVTTQYMDIEARLSNLTAQRTLFAGACRQRRKTSPICWRSNLPSATSSTRSRAGSRSWTGTASRCPAPRSTSRWTR